MEQKLRQDRNLGATLRKLRKERKMTQNEVITKLQLQGFMTTRSSYSQIECGTYNIRVSELDALAKLFEVDYNTIFEMESM